MPLPGSWVEERLLIWHIVGQLEEQQVRAAALAKSQIDAAHSKIRAAEGQVAEMQSWKWKTWAASGAAIFLSGIVIELLRLLFATHH